MASQYCSDSSIAIWFTYSHEFLVFTHGITKVEPTSVGTQNVGFFHKAFKQVVLVNVEYKTPMNAINSDFITHLSLHPHEVTTFSHEDDAIECFHVGTQVVI